jgi:hypothetical protein
MWIAIGLVGCASVAVAQTLRAPARAPRFIVSAGFIASGGYDLGDRNAELRGSSLSNPAPFTLFRADASLDGTPGLEARVAYALSPRLSIEAGGSWATPQVSVTVAQDAESIGTTAIGEEVSQYTVDIGGVVKLPWQWQSSRVQPYVAGGAGYLRQLHEDRLAVETGHTIFGGGGVQYFFRAPDRGRPFGVRAEAKLVRRAGGIDFEDKSRTHAAVSALGFIAF